VSKQLARPRSNAREKINIIYLPDTSKRRINAEQANARVSTETPKQCSSKPVYRHDNILCGKRQSNVRKEKGQANYRSIIFVSAYACAQHVDIIRRSSRNVLQQCKFEWRKVKAVQCIEKSISPKQILISRRNEIAEKSSHPQMHTGNLVSHPHPTADTRQHRGSGK
jgi:hypothetical protein